MLRSITTIKLYKESQETKGRSTKKPQFYQNNLKDEEKNKMVQTENSQSMKATQKMNKRVKAVSQTLDYI